MNKRMKQAKDPWSATAAVEAGFTGDWRSFAASSRSAYAHASALAHSRGHVSQGAAGTGAGSGERKKKVECKRPGAYGGGELARIRGSRIANDFARGTSKTRICFY